LKGGRPTERDLIWQEARRRENGKLRPEELAHMLKKKFELRSAIFTIKRHIRTARKPELEHE
jgi:hypothetical protein